MNYSALKTKQALLTTPPNCRPKSRPVNRGLALPVHLDLLIEQDWTPAANAQIDRYLGYLAAEGVES